ncbi:hypothetical protein HanIR_Chr17g0875581 [Helianthus annuus]|nr:hypothetical protein HanIR_Chr17g0875581 [Helianthus annuus]
MNEMNLMKSYLEVTKNSLNDYRLRNLCAFWNVFEVFMSCLLIVEDTSRNGMDYTSETCLLMEGFPFWG